MKTDQNFTMMANKSVAGVLQAREALVKQYLEEIPIKFSMAQCLAIYKAKQEATFTRVTTAVKQYMASKGLQKIPPNVFQEIVMKNKSVLEDLPAVNFVKTDERIFRDNFSTHQQKDQNYLKSVHEYRTQHKNKEKMFQANNCQKA